MSETRQKKEKINIPLETIQVKTETVWRDESIKYPWVDLDNQIQVSIGNNDSEEQVKFVRPDITFGRSMVESTTRNTVVWGDGFGNKFGVTDLKGGNFEKVRPTSNYAHEGNLDIFGMYIASKEQVQEMIDFSTGVRQRGIPFEAIARVDKITEFPIFDSTNGDKKNVTLLTIDEWKSHLLRMDKLNQISLLTKLNFKNLNILLNERDFFVVTRHMPVAERLWSIYKSKSNQSLYEVLQRQFEWLNVATNAGQEGIGGDKTLPLIGRYLDVNNPTDVDYYFTDYGPRYMGAVMASIHNAGYHTQYPHIQNWTGVFTPVDTECCGKLDNFPIEQVKKDTWKYLFDNKGSNPRQGVIDIFAYDVEKHSRLDNFISDRSASSKFVIRYMNEYKQRVQDERLKKVTIPVWTKIYYDIFNYNHI